MAQFHLHAQMISRSNGRSAVNAAAYRSGSKLVEYITDPETGVVVQHVWDYSHKKGVEFSQIFTPDEAVELASNREELWNKVSKAESRKDSQLAHEIDIALPVELTKEQNKELLCQIVKECFVARGIIADVNMHLDNPNNPHAHIMLTTRNLNIMPDGTIGFGLKNREWFNKKALLNVRAESASIINEHLAKWGHESRVSHLSHAERGIDLVPTVHIGVAGKRLTYAERRKLHAEIIAENAKRIRLDPNLVIDKLSISKPIFSSEEIEAELHKALMIGVNTEQQSDVKSVEDLFSKEELLAMYGVVISSTKLRLINPCDLRGRTLFAPSSKVELEHKLDEIIGQLASQRDHILEVKEITNEPTSIKDFFTWKKEKLQLTEQQEQAVLKILNGGNLSVLEGLPGSGKSTVMKVVVAYYKKYGFEVISTAMTNKASQELSAKIGVEVANTTKLRQEWQKRKGYDEAGLNLAYDFYLEKQYSGEEKVLRSKSVLIIDEASSIDSPAMYYFLREAANSGSKVILLGDNNQNPAIGSKGAFSKAGDIAGRTMLTEVNRHKNPDEYTRAMHIEATQALGRYDIAKALSIYHELGAIKVFADEEVKRAALVNDVCSKIIELSGGSNDLEALQSVAVGAYTNDEVSALNKAIRNKLNQAGIIKGKGKIYRSGYDDLVEIALGDQIIIKSNKAEFKGYGGVDNNEIGIVTKLGKVDEHGYGEFKLRIGSKENQRDVWIKTDDERYPIKFRHGYALTNYALQGVSVAYKFFSLDSHSGYEVFNVGSTRHELDYQFYCAITTLEDEVFKTQNLDVIKAKAEFKAFAYQMIGNQQQDVPLWMVGLKLLVTKRADLNFSIAYAYYNSENIAEKDRQALIEHRENIEDLQFKLEKLQSQINSDLEAKRGELKTKLEKYFVCQDYYDQFGDLRLDPSLIASARSGYFQQFPASDFTSEQVLDKHIAALKIGIIDKDGIEKLKFNELTDLDQDLIISSLLSKQELEHLQIQCDEAMSLESKLMQEGHGLANMMTDLQQFWQEQNKLLKGNLGVMREYLVARTKVLELYQKIREQEKLLRSGRYQMLIRSEIKKIFDIGIGNIAIDANLIVRAKKNFARAYFKEHEQQIAKLRADLKSYKQSKNKNSSQIDNTKEQLKKLLNVQEARYCHLLSVVEILRKQGGALSVDELNLLLAHIMDNGSASQHQEYSAATLYQKYQSLEELFNLLREAKAEREFNAKIIVEHYSTHVEGDTRTETMAKLISQLNFSFATIAKHAELDDVKHYFTEINTERTIAKHSAFIALIELFTLAQEQDVLSQFELKQIEQQLNELTEFILVQNEIIEAKKEAKETLQANDRQEIQQLEDYNKFVSTILRSYFSKIYKGDPSVVIKKLHEIWLEKTWATDDVNKFVEYITANPSIIGELKPNNLLTSLFKRTYTKAIRANLESFRSNIELFTETQIMGDIIRERRKSRNLVKQIKELQAEIDFLYSTLPNQQEQEVIANIKNLRDKGVFDEIEGGKVIADYCKQDEVLDILLNFNKAVIVKKLPNGLNKNSELEEHEVKEGAYNVKSVKQFVVKTDGANNDLSHTSTVTGSVDSLTPKITNESSYSNIESKISTDHRTETTVLKHEQEVINTENIQDKAVSEQVEAAKLVHKQEQISDTPKITNANSYSNTKPKISNDFKPAAYKPKEFAYNFESVKQALTKNDLETIFRRYANMLNPDGRIIKRSNNISCGSLNMSLINGLWCRFSDGSKGDIFKFVQQATNVNRPQALEIVASVAGLAPKIANDNFGGNKPEISIDHKAEITISKQEQWVRIPVVPRGHERHIEKDLKYLVKNGTKLENIWPYYDENSQLIGATIKVIDKETGKKQVLPLAYCKNSLTGKNKWQMRGFTDGEYKPIYRLEKINQRQSILIVEGEKTAVRAAELFPEYAVISWLGGAQGANKVNWQKIAGRSVTIWPDNDAAGMEASMTILRHINNVNGHSGLCGIVDVQSMALPTKWDLADQLPQGLTLDDLRQAIISCQTQNKTGEQELTHYEQQAVNGKNLQYKQIFWQQATIGLANNLKQIDSISILAERAKTAVEQSYLHNYFAYGELRGLFEASHEFLDYKHPLYQTMISWLLVHFQQKYKSCPEAGNVPELLVSQEPGDTGKLADLLLNLHDKALDKFADHQLTNCEAFKSDNIRLHNINAKKGELHQFLMKYFAILHQAQLGIDELSNMHKSLLSNELSSIISSYNSVSNNRQIEDYDRKTIANLAHDAINTPKWWQKLATYNLKAKTETMSKQQRELEFTFRLHQEKLEDIASFEPDFDQKKLASELYTLPEQAQNQKILDLWTKIFKDHIATPLDEIDRQKEQAKTIDQYLTALTKQKEFSGKMQSSYQKLVQHGASSLKDSRIADMIRLEKLKPDFVNIVTRDINHGADIGLWTTEEAMKKLQTAASRDLIVAIDRIERGCRQYHINTIEKELEHITQAGKIEKDNIQFTSHKAYLEHCVNHPQLKMYLKDTPIAARLEAIHKHEAHQLTQQKEQEKQQELERQQQELSKHLGKGGFGL